MSCLVACLIAGTIGWFIGWFMKPSKKQSGDLSMEGEGALRAEADSLRARVQDLEGTLADRNKELSEQQAKAASMIAAAESSQTADAPAADVTAKTTDSDDTYALEWQNRYLAARVKYLDSRLAEMSEAAPATPVAASAKAAPAKTKAAPKAKAAPKTKAVAKPKETAVTKAAPAKTKAVPKKAAAKKASAKAATAKAPAPKATAVKAAPVKKAPAKKAATTKASSVKVKAPAKSKEDAQLDKYYEKVKAFDSRASRKVVENIVSYCGVSLKSRDASLVACSDEEELKRVANGFVTKKLGLETGQIELVKDVCQQMKGTRLKSRVTFYYLAAKKAKKLSLFK